MTKKNRFYLSVAVISVLVLGSVYYLRSSEAATVQNNNSATSQANNVNATNVVVNTGSGEASGSASSAGTQDSATNQENVDENQTTTSNVVEEQVVQNNNSANSQAQNVDCTNVVVNTDSGSADGSCSATGQQSVEIYQNDGKVEQGNFDASAQDNPPTSEPTEQDQGSKDLVATSNSAIVEPSGEVLKKENGTAEQVSKKIPSRSSGPELEGNNEPQIETYNTKVKRIAVASSRTPTDLVLLCTLLFLAIVLVLKKRTSKLLE